MVERINFVELTLFFAIPLLILIGCWLVQRQWKMRLSAGVELFVFLLSLDVTLLVWYDTGVLRINPIFAAIYRPLFGILLALSFALLGASNLVQWQVVQAAEGGTKRYPLVRVSMCWLFGLATIAFHLYAILGGAPWLKH